MQAPATAAKPAFGSLEASVPAPPAALWGIAAGVLCALALMAVFGPRAHRRRLRVPLLLILAWGATTITWALPFMHVGLRDWSHLVALVCLGLAAARAAWLLVVGIALRDGAALGLSRISRDLVQSALYLVVAVAAARAAGADAQALATTGGLVTAGLTFSLQQTLGDLIAGVLLQAQAPFKVGDWIAWEQDAERIGRVLEINWRATKVTTLDRVEITVPNSVLAKASIVNLVEPEPHARRSVFLEVGYDATPRAVEACGIAAVRDVDGVLAEPAPAVHIAEFTATGVRYAVKFYIREMERGDAVAAAVRARVWYALRRHGIAFSTPRVDLGLVASQDRDSEALAARTTREQAFGTIDFLAPLTREERVAVATSARTLEYAAGETIVRAGDESTEFYLLARGRAAVVTADGRHQLAELGPGNFFGEMGLLTGEPRSATVRAVADCELYVLDRSTFSSAIAGHPRLLEQVSKIVTERHAARQSLASADETREQRALRESSLLDRMRRFLGVSD